MRVGTATVASDADAGGAGVGGVASKVVPGADDACSATAPGAGTTGPPAWTVVTSGVAGGARRLAHHDVEDDHGDVVVAAGLVGHRHQRSRPPPAAGASP